MAERLPPTIVLAVVDTIERGIYYVFLLFSHPLSSCASTFCFVYLSLFFHCLLICICAKIAMFAALLFFQSRAKKK